MAKVLVAFGVCAALVLGACYVMSCLTYPMGPDVAPAPDVPPLIVPDDAAETILLMLHNKRRAEHGRKPLVIDNGYLAGFAHGGAVRMAKTGRLTHSDLSKVLKMGYETAGENIACGQRDEQEAVDCWMRSPGHRANILSRNYTKAGFGVAKGAHGTMYWCAVFAR